MPMMMVVAMLIISLFLCLSLFVAPSTNQIDSPSFSSSSNNTTTTATVTATATTHPDEFKCSLNHIFKPNLYNKKTMKASIRTKFKKFYQILQFGSPAQPSKSPPPSTPSTSPPPSRSPPPSTTSTSPPPSTPCTSPPGPPPSTSPPPNHDNKDLQDRILQPGAPPATSSSTRDKDIEANDPTTSHNSKRRSSATTSHNSKRIIFLALGISIPLLLLLLLLITCLFCRIIGGQAAENDVELPVREGSRDILQESKFNGCRKFNLDSIIEATQNFFDGNKLGEGGFGTVFKGILAGGKEIAVKRFSSTSNQGNIEFWNEVEWITGLQHKNIVKLLGYCFEGVEKLLIYEFMTNKSLDTLLFDKTNKLDWKTRMDIIKGIAQGLVYLHENSGLNIIHLDIKPGNILLDHAMNPKISDFGTAKQFGDNQSEANPKRTFATLYMAPDYGSGVPSPKSDVYSFGIVLLEIISAPEKCDHSLGILVHTWELWCKGTPLELMDKQMAQSSDAANVAWRCIKIGLLCVQENAEDRPFMSSVLHMLENENLELPEPNKPPFATDQPNPEAPQQSALDAEDGSLN